MPVNDTLRLEEIQEFLNASKLSDPVTIDQSMLDTNFDSIGIDSLALMELVDRIQEAYQLPIPDDTVMELHTPRKLLAHVNTRLTKQSS